MVNKFIYGIDELSRTVGHAFAWCLMILTFGTTYEVFVRYVLSAPTTVPANAPTSVPAAAATTKAPSTTGSRC